VTYLYVWRYDVPPGRRSRFEETYGPAGEWVALFRKAEGYRSTRLLRQDPETGCYLTVDEWESREAFDRFRAAHAEAFEALDARCAALTSKEELIGHFEGL
jgi:heme-degrading monooxygenase HmoA